MADYVSNKELFKELVIYRAAYLKSVEEKSEPPVMSDAIASAIMRICTKLSYSYNFVGFSYREEMVSDAILKCFRKMHLFDPERTNNGFAYISQIAWNEFLLRIKAERNQSTVKAKMIKELMSQEFYDQLLTDDEYSNSFVDFLKENEVYIDYTDKSTQESSTVPNSMKHRNKTPYKTKVVKEIPTIEDVFSLANPEEV